MTKPSVSGRKLGAPHNKPLQLTSRSAFQCKVRGHRELEALAAALLRFETDPEGSLDTQVA